MRSRHALGGTNRLGEDPLAQLRSHGIAHYQVHAGAQDFLQSVLDAEEVEEPDRPVEFDEEIDIAAGFRLPAGYRTEQLERAHSQLPELDSGRS